MPASAAAAGEPVAVAFPQRRRARPRPGAAATGARRAAASPGNIAQALYVGQGYRYRVRIDGADVWAHADARIDEGAAVSVAVPRAALLVFPRAAVIVTRPGRGARPLKRREEPCACPDC